MKFCRNGILFWLWLTAELTLGTCLADVEPVVSVLEAQQTRIETVSRIIQPAVSVLANDGRGGGSGVIISPDGYALTNYHVVKPAGDFMKCSMADGNLYDAVIVGIDPTGDVALIKLLGRDDFPVAEFGDSDQVNVGDWCFVVGNPFLLATDFQPTVSFGMISGTHRYQPPAGTLLEYTDCLQTDAAINPGNSGGPLFDASGKLIGINGRCSFEKRGRVNVGVGYAISINQIKNFLGYLKSGRIVDHATLGATMTSNDQGHVVVENILESSDAFRRGLRYDTRLLRFGGRRITTVNGFKNVLGIFPRGWRVPMTYERDGQPVETLVRLAGVHSREELLQKVEGGPAPPLPEGPRTPKDDSQDRSPDDLDPQQPKPNIPRMQPPGRAHSAAPTPAHVAKLIEKRPGFANYYFNRQNRDRVWTAFVNRDATWSKNARCTLSGPLAGGGIFSIALAPDSASGRFPSGIFDLDLGTDLDQQQDPPGSGGLLVAFHVWHRLLTLGPEQFGDTYYLGTAPFPEQSQLMDVLVGTHDVVEAHFTFEPDTGLLLGLEMFPDAQQDPCELIFNEYREQAGRWLPFHIEVRRGDKVLFDLRLEEFKLELE
jgi:serine protease Do